MRIRLLAVTAATALLPLAGCGTDDAGGGGGQEAGRAEVIGSWQKEFCETVQLEAAAERMSYAEYKVGPAYLAMGDAMTPNTFDCHAEFSIKDAEGKNESSGYVMISIYNQDNANYPSVADYYTEQVAEFRDYYENMEEGLERTAREEDDGFTPILDEKPTGPWQEGVAYAMPSSGSYRGAALAAVRADGYALFVRVEYPMDPEVSQARRYAKSYEEDGEPLPDELTPEAIEAKRILPFTDAEIAEWATTEYVKAIYESVESKLSAQ